MPIISGGSGGGFTKPSQWAIGSDGSLTVVISDADGQISLQRGGATGAEVQYGVANDGGGVEEAILRVSGKGGGATSVVVANGSAAGTTSALDGRGHVELFTETGVRALEAWDDQGNALRFALLVAGQPMIGVVAAPADAALAASQVALWFDDTNGVGNTKLMVKGKSADGTVKTATVLLA